MPPLARVDPPADVGQAPERLLIYFPAEASFPSLNRIVTE